MQGTQSSGEEAFIGLELCSGPIVGIFSALQRAVEKHVASIFGKLDLPPSEGDNSRVLADLRYVRP